MAGLDIIESSNLDIERLRQLLIQKRPDVFNTPTFQLFKYGNNAYGYTLDGKNIRAFTDKDGTLYLNIDFIRRDMFFQDSLEDAGYKEIKNEDTGEFKLYKLEENNSTREIDSRSSDYFKAWQDINFYNDRIGIIYVSRKSNQGNFPQLNERFLNERILSGAVRIKNIIKFYKQGQISKEIAQKIIKSLQGKLLEQIGDPKFNKLNDPVTLDEVESYRQNKLISDELYINAIGLLGSLEMIEGGRIKDRNSTTDGLKDDLKKILEGIEIK